MACRLTSLESLTLQSSDLNAAMLNDLGVLCRHPCLAHLELIHDRSPGPSLTQLLPQRLTSLRMRNWGSAGHELPLSDMLAGATPANACTIPYIQGPRCHANKRFVVSTVYDPSAPRGAPQRFVAVKVTFL